MRITRSLIGLIVLTGLILAHAGGANACSCGAVGPPCQNAFHVDAVFAGTARRVSPVPDDGPPLGPGEARAPRTVRVEFSTVTAFRGVQGPTATVSTAGSGPACGYNFKVGERYLVYASRPADGAGLVTGTCSRTRLFADADEDLRFLQTLAVTGDARAHVSGAVTHWERDLATGESRDLGPVPDVLISVRGVGSAFDAWTDDQGRYDVSVPPGKYEITAFPPAGFSTRYLHETSELRDARACYVADFGVRFDGRISGVVRPSSDDRAEGISVELMAADSVGKTGNIQTLHASTDAGGSFEFSEVSPGKYVVGVDLTRRMDAEVVFPTTFYPGTREPALATVVQMTGGEHAELTPMTLPSARHPYRLSGTVVFQDGSPASGVFVSLSDGTAKWRQVAVGIRTDVDGTFSFVVHDGLSYIANASYWDEVQRKQFGGSVGPFVVAGETGNLKVVLSSNR